MFKARIPILALVLTLLSTELSQIGGFEPVAPPFNLSLSPVVLSLPQYAAEVTGPLRLSLESFGPDGRKHRISDASGSTGWTFAPERRPENIRIVPNAANYAGPVEVLINGKIVDRFNPLLPQSSDLLVEKILTTRMDDGAEIRVHFTDFSLEKSGDRHLPYTVMVLARKAYDVLVRELGFNERNGKEPARIEVYLGERGDHGLYPFGGFSQEDFKRAPLFILQEGPGGRKVPAILIPADYNHFISMWDRINRVPEIIGRDEAHDLAGSIMHEMTHAVLHSYHENLGSTEHSIRNGDWYTEGLARYYETKVGSQAGFASFGFRKRQGDRVQFSRGGANYFLKYPDESFFSMRYENALFWLYFEKIFGQNLVVELTRRFRGLEFSAAAADYARVLEETTGRSFDKLLVDYFNWVYRGDYKLFGQSCYLEDVAKTVSHWVEGEFRFVSASGKTLEHSRVLDTDRVDLWADESSKNDENSPGDWTPQSDIKPLGFDVQEIRFDDATPQKLIIRNKGGSQKVHATIYFEAGKEGRSVSWTIGAGREIEIKGIPPGSRGAGIVLVNQDFQNTCNYEIELK